MDKLEIRKFIGRTSYTIEQVMLDLNVNDSRILFLADEMDVLIGSITDGDIRRFFLGGGKIDDAAIYAANKNPKFARTIPEARLLYDKRNYIAIPIVNEKGSIIDIYDGDEELKRLLLIGGGGHCRSVADSVLTLKAYSKIGIIDYDNSQALGIPVVGTDEDLPQMISDGWTDAFITVGSVGNTQTRRRLYNLVKNLGYHIPSIVDPTATVARKVRIGEGAYIGKRAVINTGSWIGPCTIINTGAIVEHDCVIGDFSHISPEAVLCGQVYVGDDSHIGAASVVRQQIRIGNGAVIGAGSVVVKNIPDSVKAFGNPCKVRSE